MLSVIRTSSKLSHRRATIFTWFRCLLFLLPGLIPLGCGQSDAPVATAGVMDLSNWSFADNQRLSLNGQWEFYPGHFYAPADFVSGNVPHTAVFCDVPGSFTANSRITSALGQTGFGTYRLKIHINEPMPLTLKMGDTWSAYRLWVNGRFFLASGHPGIDAKSEAFRYGRGIVPELPNDDSLEIVIQISNFHASTGGLLQAPVLGEKKTLVQSHQFEWVWRNFILGGLTIMGFYHFMIFLFRRKERSHLLLGIYGWLWTINFAVTTTSVWMLPTVFPDIPLSLLRRIDHVSFYISMPVNIHLVGSLFPGEIRKHISRLAFPVFIAASIVSCVLPLHRAENMVVYMLVIIIPFLFTAFFAVCKAMFNRRPGARLAFAGYIVLTAMAVNDMLLISRMINTVELIFIGIFLFMLLQSTAVSIRFSKAFSAVERLSAQQANHLRMAAELEERRLSESEAKWNVKLQVQEKLRFQFAPHFLFNALNSIRASIIDDPNAAREMLTSLSELNRIAVKNRTRTSVTVSEELQMAHLYLELEKARYGDYLSVAFNVSPASTKCRIPCFILQPLVENAIKHGKRTSPEQLQIDVAIYQRDENLFVAVSNSGRWLSPDETSTDSSVGFGLNHLQERLKFLNGTLTSCEQNNQVRIEARIPLSAVSCD